MYTHLSETHLARSNKGYLRSGSSRNRSRNSENLSDNLSFGSGSCFLVFELYDVSKHPYINHGGCKLTVDILSPTAGVPANNGFAIFLEGSYHQVKKELAGGIRNTNSVDS